MYYFLGVLLFFSAFENDTLDNAIFPTEGTRVVLNADITAPILDVKFYRLGVSSQQFFPLSPEVTTRIKGDFGYIDSYGGDVLPFYKMFHVGGQKTIRGFKEASVGKKVYDDTYKDFISNGGNTTIQLSTETFFPVPGIKKNESLRMSAFIDGGGVFANGIKFEEMRVSFGAAGVWISPFGPMTVSYAVPLNDNGRDKLEQFQFGMGTNF